MMVIVLGASWMFFRTVAAASAWSLLTTIALAQTDNPTPVAVAGSVRMVSALTSVELWLAAAIIVFGLVVLGMQFVLLRRVEAAADDVLRLFTVTTIIIGTMSLIAVGYSSQQIAPALGLFGTILGYLLGKSDERMRNRAAQIGDAPSGGTAASTPLAPAKPPGPDL
ncbi:hypothetical protein [Falsiroseomonas sp. E2-1-a4]|uniref:hypothetical protein n=1 Tax=Falsiroseomonas sp. E2-1-a4 TaxID=3239299 RepID=UPI003F36CB55